MPNSQFCGSCRPQLENKRKRKERKVLGPCQRTKKYETWRWSRHLF